MLNAIGPMSRLLNIVCAGSGGECSLRGCSQGQSPRESGS